MMIRDSDLLFWITL